MMSNCSSADTPQANSHVHITGKRRAAVEGRQKCLTPELVPLPQSRHFCSFVCAVPMEGEDPSYPQRWHMEEQAHHLHY